MTWRSKWNLYWDEPHPKPRHKRLQRSRRTGVELFILSVSLNMTWPVLQVGLVAASSWSLQDTENWRNGWNGFHTCPNLGNGSTGRDHETSKEPLLLMTDGPPVFLCHFSCTSQRFKQTARFSSSQEKNKIWESLFMQCM